MSRRTKILFTLSILLNVLLLGAHAGMMVKRAYDNPWSHAYSDLDPESQSIVAREFQVARKDMKQSRDDFRDARKAVTEILEVEILDKDAYEAALEKMQASQQKMMEKKMVMMREIMAKLPPEEREKLSHRMMRPFGKHNKRNRVGPHPMERAP